jgi:hypothetical protein
VRVTGAGGADGGARPDLRTVRIVGFPLDIGARANQHGDELVREFTLISMDAARNAPGGQTDERHLPARLVQLVEELTHSFSGFTASVDEQRQAAVARGDTSVDLTYHLPAAAADAARRIGDILDEADEFCRAGQHLITLATPAEGVAFRRWYLAEFVQQIEHGREPLSWAEYAARHGVGEAAEA